MKNVIKAIMIIIILVLSTSIVIAREQCDRSDFTVLSAKMNFMNYLCKVSIKADGTAIYKFGSGYDLQGHYECIGDNKKLFEEEQLFLNWFYKTDLTNVQSLSNTYGTKDVFEEYVEYCSKGECIQYGGTEMKKCIDHTGYPFRLKDVTIDRFYKTEDLIENYGGFALISRTSFSGDVKVLFNSVHDEGLMNVQFKKDFNTVNYQNSNVNRLIGEEISNNDVLSQDLFGNFLYEYKESRFKREGYINIPSEYYADVTKSLLVCARYEYNPIFWYSFNNEESPLDCTDDTLANGFDCQDGFDTSGELEYCVALEYDGDSINDEEDPENEDDNNNGEEDESFGDRKDDSGGDYLDNVPIGIGQGVANSLSVMSGLEEVKARSRFNDQVMDLVEILISYVVYLYYLIIIFIIFWLFTVFVPKKVFQRFIIVFKMFAYYKGQKRSKR